MFLALLFRDGHPSHWVASRWAWLVLWTCRVKVVLSGAENIDRTKTYVLASNHQSLYDTPILFAYLPLSFRILYKKALNRIPFLGWHLFVSGHIPVERQNPSKARRSIENAADRIRQGTSVVVFPEGTRSYDGVMRSFKKGSFILAIRAGTPILPVTISGSHRVMKRGEVTVFPRTVRVHVHSSVDVSDFEEDQALELGNRVREIIGRRLKEESEVT